MAPASSSMGPYGPSTGSGLQPAPPPDRRQHPRHKTDRVEETGVRYRKSLFRNQMEEFRGKPPSSVRGPFR